MYQCAWLPRCTQGWQHPAVKTVPAGYAPGKDQANCQHEQQRIGADGSSEQIVDVHQPAEERRNARKTADDQAHSDQDFAYRDCPGHTAAYGSTNIWRNPA